MGGGGRTRLSAAWHSTNDVKVTRQIKRGEGSSPTPRNLVLNPPCGVKNYNGLSKRVSPQ